MKKNASNDARAGARADGGAEKTAKNAAWHAHADETAKNAARHARDDETAKNAARHARDGESERNCALRVAATESVARSLRKNDAKREPARTPLEKKKRMIVDRMQKLGVYRVQYMAAINRTAEMYVELDRLMQQYEDGGCEAIVEHTNKAGATNLVKNPIRRSIEDVYSQLLAHERELGLTPGAMKKLGDAKPESQMSPLEAALKKLSAG